MSSASTTFGAGGTISPSAAQVNGWAQGTLGYAQVTANQAGIAAGPTDLTGLSVTVTVVAGRRVRVRGHVQLLTVTAAAGYVIEIQEGATILGRCGLSAGISTGEHLMCDGEIVINPSAGSHTYKLTATRYAGTGTLTVEAASTQPATLLVEDIGAV